MASTPYQTTDTLGFPGFYHIQVPVFAASAITNADELTDFVPGHYFTIERVDFVCVTPITTAAKTATMTPYIDTVAVPGTVTAVAGTKAKGVVSNAFTASTTSRIIGTPTSKVKLTASAVTAFAEGAGYWDVLIRNTESNPS